MENLFFPKTLYFVFIRGSNSRLSFHSVKTHEFAWFSVFPTALFWFFIKTFNTDFVVLLLIYCIFSSRWFLINKHLCFDVVVTSS